MCIRDRDYINAALDRYKFKNLEDMYASVGFGAISQVKIISRMLEEYRKSHKEENIEQKIEELTSKRKTVKPSSTGVVVKGIDNCLVKLSKCCNPVPGDNIIGYITKGRGVSVHRTDCVNVKDLLKEEDRIIDVYWYTEKAASYNVDITVYANDSNVNIVSADNYESREFNQWKRAKYNFSFNVSTEKKTIKALCSAVLTATGTAIGSCGGEGAAIAGSAIGAGISSYASDCICLLYTSPSPRD